MFTSFVFLLLLSVTGAFYILWGFEKATKKTFKFFMFGLIISTIIFMIIVLADTFGNEGSSSTEERLISLAFWPCYLIFSFLIGYICGLLEKKYGKLKQ